MRIRSWLSPLILPTCIAGLSQTILDNQNQITLQASHSDGTTSNELSKIISASPLLTLHRALCEIESITDNELSVGKYLVDFLEAHNFSVTTQKVPPPGATNSTKERLNIYAVPRAADAMNKATPKVLLSSHIDTVPPFIPYSLSLPKSEVSSSKKKSFKREDVLISGRGTVDAKACVAAQIATVMDLVSSKSNNIKVSASDLALLFVVGEERRGDGMLHFSNSSLYESTNADYKAVIFGEPTEGKLASGHKGITMVHIAAHGKAAHSGYPWLGRSANSMILPALMVLDRLGDFSEDEGGLPRSKKYGRSTVNVGRMQGGVAANVVPEYADADVSFRLAGGTAESVRGIVTRAIRSADPEGLLELDFSQGYGPVGLDTDVDGFDSMTVNYGTDVPNLEVAEGVKRYLYGPGSILVAHGADEALTVGDMEAAVEGYKKLVLHALKS